jgi:hypothetical protein
MFPPWPTIIVDMTTRSGKSVVMPVAVAVRDVGSGAEERGNRQ